MVLVSALKLTSCDPHVAFGFIVVDLGDFSIGRLRLWEGIYAQLGICPFNCLQLHCLSFVCCVAGVVLLSVLVEDYVVVMSINEGFHVW